MLHGTMAGHTHNPKTCIANRCTQRCACQVGRTSNASLTATTALRESAPKPHQRCPLTLPPRATVLAVDLPVLHHQAFRVCICVLHPLIPIPPAPGILNMMMSAVALPLHLLTTVYVTVCGSACRYPPPLSFTGIMGSRRLM